MTKIEILQHEIQRLQRQLEKLKSFERPLSGNDMTAERMRLINERIQKNRDMINANMFDASASRIKRKFAPRRLRATKGLANGF